jgi:hypothetical protein
MNKSLHKRSAALGGSKQKVSFQILEHVMIFFHPFSFSSLNLIYFHDVIDVLPTDGAGSIWLTKNLSGAVAANRQMIARHQYYISAFTKAYYAR